MRRKALLGTVFGLMLGMVVAFGPNASAGGRTWYAGHTGPRQRVLFSVAEKAGGRQVFSPVLIDFTVTCPATGDIIDAEFSFSGFRVPMHGGRFDLNLSDIFTKFDWSGKVGPSSARGHLVAGFPAYDASGNLQDCTAGDLTWHAKGLSAPRVGPGAAGGTMSFLVTKSPDGSVHTQVTR